MLAQARRYPYYHSVCLYVTLGTAIAVRYYHSVCLRVVQYRDSLCRPKLAGTRTVIAYGVRMSGTQIPVSGTGIAHAYASA
eukprot:3937424-Rhodomonas_salina.2